MSSSGIGVNPYSYCKTCNPSPSKSAEESCYHGGKDPTTYRLTKLSELRQRTRFIWGGWVRERIYDGLKSRKLFTLHILHMRFHLGQKRIQLSRIYEHGQVDQLTRDVEASIVFDHYVSGMRRIHL